MAPKILSHLPMNNIIKPRDCPLLNKDARQGAYIKLKFWENRILSTYNFWYTVVHVFFTYTVCLGKKISRLTSNALPQRLIIKLSGCFHPRCRMWLEQTNPLSLFYTVALQD